MKIAVCDDDIQCIAQVCALLEQWSQQKKIALTLYHFSDGDELLRAHQIFGKNIKITFIVFVENRKIR